MYCRHTHSHTQCRNSKKSPTDCLVTLCDDDDDDYYYFRCCCCLCCFFQIDNRPSIEHEHGHLLIYCVVNSSFFCSFAVAVSIVIIIVAVVVYFSFAIVHSLFVLALALVFGRCVVVVVVALIETNRDCIVHWT